MKIQNFAVVFIIIIMPIAMVLSIYTGNLIDVANTQASYDSILLSSTYDAIRAYQMNTLDNDYESENNSKVRDINASVNSFFNSLAMGFSSSRLGKEELKSYIPAMLYTLYDGYYIYGTYDNIVDTVGEISYNENTQVNKKEYGLKPYVYYSCEYQGITDNSVEYDIIVNYTLDNYITVTGRYGNTYISRSGYYIDFRPEKISVISEGTKPASFDQKIVTLYPGSENEVVILPEALGEYLMTIDIKREREKPTETKNVLSQKDEKAKYYNYIIYNNVKYYLDDEMINADGTPKPVDRENEINYSHNMTYDGIPIFYLDRDTRTYISQSTLDELKSYLGVDNNLDLYTKDKSKNKFKDVNAYYYYFKSTQFSKDVYNVLKDINLGKTTITNTETGETEDVILSNLPYDKNGNIVDSNGQVRTGNVIKTETYHTKYTYQNGVESHVKSTYDTSKIFNFEEEDNNPELESSSFNRHRIDVIISSIESSLVSSMASFNSYIGATYEYNMPVLEESEWDRICNNIAVVSFMQGLTIGNYKYYSNYAIVANTKVKDFISKESIYLQNTNIEEANNGEYHNPRCIDYNNEISKNPKGVVGYRNIDYDRQNCILPNYDGTTNSEYWYYLQPGTGAYECIVGQNNNKYSTDELLKGIKKDGSLSNVNKEIRRAYITALAREKGNTYKAYGFLNQELQQKTPLTEGEALYTVHYFYQDYDNETGNPKSNYIELGEPFNSTALVGTPITSLTLHTTPRRGYRYRGNDFIEITRNAPEDGNWTRLKDLSGEDRNIKKGTTTHIALYFDMDTSQKKTLHYNLETHVWDANTMRFNLVKTDTIYDTNKWINSDNDITVNVPNNYNGIKLAYTDPAEYVQAGKRVTTGSTIKAYYSNNPEFIGKTFIVRYHANTGTGTMDDNTFKFLESNQLTANKFTKYGSEFKGWALSENGNVVYSDSDIILYGTAQGLKFENNEYYLDLYAVWSGLYYQVSYQSNGSTSGDMENSTHQYGVKAKLNKNQYIREFNVTFNIGTGKTNFYVNENAFGAWGNSAKVNYNKNSKEYQLSIPAGGTKYSGIYYTSSDAVLKSGKTAVISYEVYSDIEVTLVFKKQNSIVGQPYGNDGTNRKDESGGTGLEYVTIPAKQWKTIYFTYTNKSKNSIYDYSILSVEDTSRAVNLVIKNPKFEIANVETTQIEENGTIKEKAKVSSKFLYWTYNNQNYVDEQEVLNLTDQNGATINMTAQWEDYKLYLPELLLPGYDFVGWVDENGTKINSNQVITITKDSVFTAVWEDETPPEVDIVVVNTTSSTITTKTTAEDKGSGMIGNIKYKYYIKEHGKPDSSYQTYEVYNSPEYTFKGLKQQTRYDIKVEVISDNAGNIGTDSTDGTTRELTGKIYVKSYYWVQDYNNEGTEVVVFGANNISSDDIYIESKKENSNTWVKNDTVSGLKHGETALGRLTDGTNYLDNASMKAWDSVRPTINLYNTTEIEKAFNSINIKINAFDRESGLGRTPTYTYSYKRSVDTAWSSASGTTNTIFELKNLQQNTLYNIKVNVSDIAGNLGEAIINVQTSYKYRIIFNGNGANNGSMDPLECIKDVPKRLTKNAFTRTGYNFTYWTDKNNNRYNDEDYIGNLSSNGEDVNLYANWGDTEKPIIQSVTPSYTYVDIVATDDGSGIVGYTVTNDATLPGSFTPCGAATNTLQARIPGLSRETIYYVWVQDAAGNISDPKIVTTLIETYTISYDANGGQGAPEPQTKKYNQTIQISGTQPTRSGYIFRGWGTGVYDTVASYLPGADYTNNNSIVLYAVWQLDQKFIVQNGYSQVGAWAVTPGEFRSKVNRITSEGPIDGFGFTYVGTTAEDAFGTGWIDAIGIATPNPVDLRGYTKIVFEFMRWARDGSYTGYYGTCAGLFSNQTVAARRLLCSYTYT